jgi:hypothetical protein
VASWDVRRSSEHHGRAATPGCTCVFQFWRPPVPEAMLRPTMQHFLSRARHKSMMEQGSHQHERKVLTAPDSPDVSKRSRASHRPVNRHRKPRLLVHHAESHAHQRTHASCNIQGQTGFILCDRRNVDVSSPAIRRQLRYSANEMPQNFAASCRMDTLPVYRHTGPYFIVRMDQRLQYLEDVAII